MYRGAPTLGARAARALEYKGTKLECGYRLDLVVEDALVVEIKCVDGLLPIHKAQLLTYLRLTKLQAGLLVNFRETVLKNGLRRLILSPDFASSRLPVNLPGPPRFLAGLAKRRTRACEPQSGRARRGRENEVGRAGAGSESAHRGGNWSGHRGPSRTWAGVSRPLNPPHPLRSQPLCGSLPKNRLSSFTDAPGGARRRVTERQRPLPTGIGQPQRRGDIVPPRLGAGCFGKGDNQ
jgi:hypothetical protein